MAKIVLKLDKEHVRDVDKQLGGDAFVENLLLDIINTQNMQIMMVKRSEVTCEMRADIAHVDAQLPGMEDKARRAGGV